jgi:hypothetical protein
VVSVRPPGGRACRSSQANADTVLWDHVNSDTPYAAAAAAAAVDRITLPSWPKPRRKLTWCYGMVATMTHPFTNQVGTTL